MNGKEKIILDRVVYLLIAVVLVAAVFVIYGILGIDASFAAGIGSSDSVTLSSPDACVASIDEPDDAYQLAVVTFCGTCTPASMLGSDSFGTFNQSFNDNGAEYFFSRLRDIFARDDMTVGGLNAVLTDRNDLTAAEKDIREWYRAPADTASIFSLGGVDVLSLGCARTMDYGLDGYADTKAALEANSVTWSDTGKAVYATLTGDITCALYCGAYSEEALPGIHTWITEAVQSNDFVALYITDSDDSYTVSDGKRNAFRSFIDSGADLVVGTNGTKLQPAEEWGDGYIAYSLGSVVDGSSKYPEHTAALLDVRIRSDFGEIIGISYDIIPCATYDENNSWCPKVMEDGAERDNVLAFMNGERELPN